MSWRIQAKNTNGSTAHYVGQYLNDMLDAVKKAVTTSDITQIIIINEDFEGEDGND